MSKKPDLSSISRRRLLGGAATIGGAAALGGTGTLAFFSDEETFANNQLVAGELDLKVDWEEHYSDWSADEDDAEDEGTLDIQMHVDDTSGYTAFPPGVEAYDDGSPLLYVNNDDVGQFMDNTSIEAFPDSDDDGVQDDFDAENACEVLADVGPEDDGLDPDGLRTDNEDTRLNDGSAAPLVNLQDVKPGDFGEATLSFHICDNPGYVWLQGQPVTAAENGHTEPEAKDPDEEGPPDESYSINQAADVDTILNSNIELLDAVQTAWWYDDNCDNLTQEGGTATGGEADVMIVADGSGSVTGNNSKFQALQDGAEDLVDSLGSNVRVGLTVFANNATTVTTLGDSKSKTISEIQDDGNYPSGGTDLGAGIVEGQDQLMNGQGARSGVDKILVVLTNGVSSTGRSEATNAKDAGTTIYGIAYGSGADEDLIEDISSPPKTDDGMIDDQDEFAFVADETDIGDVFTDIGGTISLGEEIFFQGDLRTALTALSSGNGIPLDGDGGNDFDEIGGDPTAEERGCFDPSPAGHCIGFSWWLPVDHANEIQGDSVTFDLGFYTEQCRHNDGSGMTAGNSAT